MTKSNLVSIEDQYKNDGLLMNGLQWGKWEYTGDYSFKPGTTIQFTNPGLGLFSNISKPYGTIMPGDSLNISYTIKTDSLFVLPYTENLVMVTNDPYRNPTIHNAKFNIEHGGSSLITIDTTQLNFGTLYKGAVKKMNFIVSNKGKASDSLVSATFDNNYFTLNGTVPAFLKPERSEQYTVIAKTAMLGDFTDTLRITSANGQHFKIALSLEVIQGPVISLLNSGGASLTSITRFLNAGNNATVNFKIKNSGSVDLHVAPANNDWEMVTETVQSPVENVSYTYKKSTEYGGPTYEWVEIVGTGINVSEQIDPWFGKNWAKGIKMPFAFRFYGKEYDSLYIGNGLVTFTPDQNRVSTFWGGGPIPDTTQPNNYIAPLFIFGGPDTKALYPLSGAYYQLYPDRVIVEYRDYNSNFTMGEPISFEVILFANGNIKFQYVMPVIGANTITDYGTIGVENTGGTDGVMISYYQKVVNSDMAISLYPARSYKIAPAETKDFKMLLDAKDLIEGSYADSVAFTNNDPDHLNLKLPVKLVVTGTPAIEVPQPLVYDTVQINPAVATVTKEFEIKNTGSANFTLTGISQLNSADVKVEVYTKVNDTWMWQALSAYAFPSTLNARTSLKMRSTITPVTPKVVHDTLVINTSLTPAVYKVPVLANIYTPATISLSADTVACYAQSDDYTTAKAIKIGNEKGGLNLNYTMSINFVRAAAATKTAMAKAGTTTTAKATTPDVFPATLNMATKSKATTAKQMLAANDYNQVMAWDNDTVPATRLGYNGSRAFYSATGFNAPADGFLLSHVQCWFVPGDWLSTKIKVMVYAGNESIYECQLLATESFDFSTPQADDRGSLLTYKLANAIKINPNEKFFIVFGFEAALTYPQGCARKTEVVKNRFLFGSADEWYDLASYQQFNTIGWYTRAAEETAGDIPWVILTSAAQGTVDAGHADSIHLSFTARTADNSDNIAYLKIKSNDINHPEKKVVLRLVKNTGPAFTTPAGILGVSENDSITFTVSASDIQGDAFSFAIDSAYKFLTEVPYTEPDPLKKTLKYVYKPDYNSAGQHDFTYTGSDSYGNVSTGKVTVNVKNVNRMPVALPIDTLKFTPYGNYMVLGPYDVFTDPDHDLATLEAVSQNNELLNLFVSGNSFLLMPGSSGLTSVTFLVTDKLGAKATSTIPVSISEIYTGIATPGHSSSELFVYPNPTRGKVNAILPSGVNGKVTLTVYTAQGNAVKEEVFSTGSFNIYDIDLSDLPAGLYFLKWNNNNMQQTSRIIKQ